MCGGGESTYLLVVYTWYLLAPSGPPGPTARQGRLPGEAIRGPSRPLMAGGPAAAGSPPGLSPGVVGRGDALVAPRSRPPRGGDDRARGRAGPSAWSVASLVLPGPGCEWHPGVRRREPGGSPGARHGLCGPLCVRAVPPVRAYSEPARPRLPAPGHPAGGPRVSQCRLRVLGPSSGTLGGVTDGESSPPFP